MRPAQILLVVSLIFTGCSARSRASLTATANRMADAAARANNPHIAWCDNHNGFLQRTTDTEMVQVSDSNTGMPIGTGRITHTFIVCNDGTRFQE